MELQLKKMQEVIDLIRNASDEELHEILISIGAKSTRTNGARWIRHSLKSKENESWQGFDSPLAPPEGK